MKKTIIPLFTFTLFLHLSLSAALPQKWDVELAAQPPQVFTLQRPRGETYELEAVLKMHGKPFAPAITNACIYWQTNGMENLYWSAPASVSNNCLRASWLPSMDPGATSVRGYIGDPGRIYAAAFQFRFIASPGATPNVLPLPTPVIDFAKVTVLNPPWGSGGGDGATALKIAPYLFERTFDDTYPEDAAWYYHQPQDYGSCSARRVGGVLERNYDWKFDDAAEFVVRMTATPGHFASVGVANCGTNLTEEFVTSGKPSRYYKCLPGRVVDGINEKGVVCEVNVLDTPSQWPTTGEIHCLAAVRWALDHGTSAGMVASNLVAKIYIPAGFGNFHWMIADAYETWIVENGTARIIGHPAVMTNFRLLVEGLNIGAYQYETNSISPSDISSDAYDRELYVDPVDGDDTADGSATSPLKTIAQAASKTTEGTSTHILLMDGEHVITSRIDFTLPATVHIEGLSRDPKKVIIRSTMDNDRAISAYGDGVDFLLRFATLTGAGKRFALIKDGRIANCFVTGNSFAASKDTSNDGGVIYITNNAIVENCLFYGNTVNETCAQLSCKKETTSPGYAHPRVINCTFINPAKRGGVASDWANCEVINCVDYGSGQGAKIHNNYNVSTRLHQAGDYASGAAGFVQLTSDPFVDSAHGDYRPNPGSPLIGAGDLSAYRAYAISDVDLNGNPRGTNDPSGEGKERYDALVSGAAITNVWFTRAYSPDTNWLTDFFGDTNSMAQAKSYWATKSKEAHRGESFGGESWWQTVHTSIYDITNRTLRIAVQEQDDWYTFALPKTGTDEEEVRRIAQEEIKVASVNGMTGDVHIAAADIGAVTSEDLDPLANDIRSAFAWSRLVALYMTANTNAWFAGTNYVFGADAAARTHFSWEAGMNAGTVPCSMALYENRDGVKQCVWDQRDWTVWYWSFKAAQLRGEIAATNDAIYAAIAHAVTNHENHAWAKHYASSGRPNPDPTTTFIDTPSVCLSPGMSWETVATVGGCGYWSIVGNSAVIGGSGTNATLAIKDFEGNTILEITKGEHYLAWLDSADFTGQMTDSDHWVCFDMLTSVQPIGYFSTTPYHEDFVSETDANCPAQYRWENRGNGIWRIHFLLKPGIESNACFAKFMVEVEGKTQIKYNADTVINGGLIFEGVKIAPVIPSSHSVGTIIQWKVVQ